MSTDTQGLRAQLKQARDHVTQLQRRCDDLLQKSRGIRHLVWDFHAKFNYPTRRKPAVPADDEVRFRLKLLAEEFIELLSAALGEYHTEPWLASKAKAVLYHWIDNAPIEVNMREFVDAQTDLDYVNEGTRLTFGYDGWPALLEVHRANMSKEASQLADADNAKINNVAKAQKPPGWRPPDMGRVLREQGWEGDAR